MENGNLIAVSCAFHNPAWTSGSSQFTYCWSLAWRILRIPCGSAGKESAHNAGDLDSVPGLGRSPGEREGYPLQYSGLQNSMTVQSMGSQRVGHDRALSLSLASMWNECSCAVIWAFFGIAFLLDWNENWLFPVLWPLLSFPNLLCPSGWPLISNWLVSEFESPTLSFSKSDSIVEFMLWIRLTLNFCLKSQSYKTCFFFFFYLSNFFTNLLH